MAKAKKKGRGRTRGRKPKEAARKPCGRLKQPSPTERGQNDYLLARKIEETNATDMPLTPLGILAGRKLLTAGQYKAASDFQSTYRAFWAQHDAVRTQDPKGVLSRTISEPGDQDADIAAERLRRAEDPFTTARLNARYAYYERTLKEAFPQAWSIVTEIVIYGEKIGWANFGWLGHQIKSADLIRVEGKIIARSSKSSALPTTLSVIAMLGEALAVIGGEEEDERLRRQNEARERQEAEQAARVARMAARAATEKHRRVLPVTSQAQLDALAQASA